MEDWSIGNGEAAAQAVPAAVRAASSVAQRPSMELPDQKLIVQNGSH
jgi:hypothetical protein